jgi:hypothetical protein
MLKKKTIYFFYLTFPREKKQEKQEKQKKQYKSMHFFM